MSFKMRTPIVFFLTFLLGYSAVLAARNSADLQPPQVRQVSVMNAEKMWHRSAPPALPLDLPSPFSPVDFDKPEPSELPIVSTPAGGPDSKKPPSAPISARPTPVGDREILEKLAVQISPTGMIMLRGSPRIVISNKPFEVGTRFTATYNNQDYELELVAIDRTTFTLRYRSEEIIRPIKPVR